MMLPSKSIHSLKKLVNDVDSTSSHNKISALVDNDERMSLVHDDEVTRKFL